MPTIELTDEQYKALQKGEDIVIKGKVKKWEPEGGIWCITGNNTIGNSSPTGIYEKSGRARATKELAQIAAENSRKRDRLEAHLHENYPDWRADWNDVKQEKWMVYYCYSTGKWCMCYTYDAQNVGCVYGPKEWAEEAINMLNDGVMGL